MFGDKLGEALVFRLGILDASVILKEIQDSNGSGGPHHLDVAAKWLRALFQNSIFLPLVLL
jgi:hypothetical protein